MLCKFAQVFFSRETGKWIFNFRVLPKKKLRQIVPKISNFNIRFLGFGASLPKFNLHEKPGKWIFNFRVLLKKKLGQIVSRDHNFNIRFLKCCASLPKFFLTWNPENEYSISGFHVQIKLRQICTPWTHLNRKKSTCGQPKLRLNSPDFMTLNTNHFSMHDGSWLSAPKRLRG